MPTKPVAVLRTLLFVSFAALPSVARAQASSAACKPVLDAHTKEISTPHHLYSTRSASAQSKQKITGEVISTATASYVLYKGKWEHLAVTPQDNIAQMQENLRNTKVYQCRRLPDASIDGVAANVYSAHAENEDVKNDTQLWVAKSTGLIVREEIDIDTGDDGGKGPISERYDYTNVQPPPGVK